MAKSLIRSFPGVRRVSILQQQLRFPGSASYWEQRYIHGQSSGSGSYGETAVAKAKFLNTFVKENNVESIIEFGCGDGNQLTLAEYPRYVGLDVSRSAIGLCRRRFSDDTTKSFFLYDGECFVDKGGVFTSEMAISLDVIFHLVEETIFEAYMSQMFAAATRYVIIYSTDRPITGTAPHVRHRNFSSWVGANQTAWRLIQKRVQPKTESSQADFYVYEHIDG
jgi:hypothetical protein